MLFPWRIHPFSIGTALLLSIIVTACGHTAVRWRVSSSGLLPRDAPVFVSIQPGPALPPDTAKFAEVILGIVRSHGVKAEILAGSQARGRGAGYLLMVTVHRWRDAQTQYDGEPDGIDMTVRLTQLGSADVAGEFEFHAEGSRLAVRDEAAGRLLGDKLRRAIDQLLGF
jgi:hypothetical protein